ncbi:hypothetical protein [Gemmobacter sp. 24YEA27]|uniref:hypothetical protein n=1 Tax=Gemmobacter sp. 24YEA27 TaxID=3040672 RepID=UPI0024B37770|nr:hypothetical protein [Gemmobacter sp. 24YEA27]
MADLYGPGHDGSMPGRGGRSGHRRLRGPGDCGISTSVPGDGLSGWARLFNNPKYMWAIGNTLLSATAVTLLATLLGVPLAYVTAPQLSRQGPERTAAADQPGEP